MARKLTIAERLIAIHRALAAHEVPHAFGGAVALAYWVSNPRGTDDIDINIFAPPERCEEVLAALPDEVELPLDAVEKIVRDAQIRLRWPPVPLDLFFNSVPLHKDAARHTRAVPYGGVEIPILAALELGIFKAMYNRNRDWPDIEAMIRAGTLDVEAVRKALIEMFGPDDRRIDRLDETVREAAKPDPGDMESPWRPPPRQ